MKTLARCCSLLSLLFAAACGTVHDWRELRTDPMTFGECYDGLMFVVQNSGLAIDDSTSDRGLGKLQTRWRERVLDNTHPGRFRLVAEIMIDEGTTATGWPLRYAIEQEQVKDLRHSVDPREEDWSKNGQDNEGEALLGDRLVRRLAPKALRAPPRRQPTGPGNP